MLKSDEASFYHSSSPSTESDGFSENNKSLDTVSKLFSSLLKNPESTLKTDKPSTSITCNISNELFSTKNDCSHNELPNHDICTRICDPSTPKEMFDFNSPPNNSTHSEMVHNETDSNNFKKKHSLAASSETVVIDRNGQYSNTPFNSKIPVLHPRSDPLSYYEEPHRSHNIGLKPVNDNSLRKMCSNSKIPVSTRQPSYRRVLREPFTPFVENCYRRPLEVDRAPSKRTDRGTAPGRYTHVKSKLAAYINRPTKMDASRSSQPKSSNERQVKNDDYSAIKRMNSRTSLDTYTCEYKVPLSELNCSDCATTDVTKNHQRAREHFELALEHNRIKMENEKIVTEHRRIVTKHRQLMLEHEKKANEHTLKAIAHVLNRIT